VIALTNLFTLSCRGYRVKMRNCTVRYSGCTVSGRHPARHLHRTDVLREQLPASRAYCDCTVPSTHLPAVGSYMITMKTSQKQARKTCKVNILYTQCIRIVLCSSFLQQSACTPPLVVSFQWETRDLYTLVCLDQECYDECECIDLSRGYLT